ncbi:antibiotic biosynthesis monooxygenase family protein [Humibacter ginsengiterrae]
MLAASPRAASMFTAVSMIAAFVRPRTVSLLVTITVLDLVARRVYRQWTEAHQNETIVSHYRGVTMFARVQTIQTPAEKLDVLEKLAREQLDAAPTLSGFRDFYFLTDRDNGKALVISFWETEADLRRLESSNASIRDQVKAEAQLESPSSEVFEVALKS